MALLGMVPRYMHYFSQQWFYATLAFLADSLEDVFWRHSAPVTYEQPSETDRWDAAEVVERIRRADRLPDSMTRPGGGESSMTVFIVGSSTISKVVDDPSEEDEDPVELQREVLALELVRRHTSIPVPRVYPHLTIKDTYARFVTMDFIEGERLDRAWPKMSLLKKIQAAWTLRSYVRQLRRIQIPEMNVPGPLGPRPRTCRGVMFGRRYEEGPFNNQEELAVYLNARARNARESCRIYGPGPWHFNYENNATGRLVFTHGDLNMRNIIVGKDGRLWLIDFDWSGFYPEYCEYINMALPVYHGEFDIPHLFKRCIPFITGPYFDRELWLFGWSFFFRLRP